MCYIITTEPSWHTDRLLIFMLWTVGHLRAGGLSYLSFDSVPAHDIIWQWQQYLKYQTAAIIDKVAGKEVTDEDGGRLFSGRVSQDEGRLWTS